MELCQVAADANRTFVAAAAYPLKRSISEPEGGYYCGFYWFEIFPVGMVREETTTLSC